MDDPTTAYAHAVLDGSIVAGPWVRLACQRHLDMLGDKSGAFYFDVAMAQRLIDFFPDMLKVDVAGELVPFELLDWQVFCAGSINGWRNSRSGFRLFTEVYIEGGKGCGKTPFAAGIGHYMLIADGEHRAEVYSAAAKRDQAALLFADAVDMKNNSPQLKTRLVDTGKNPVWKLTHRPSGSFFRPLSADKKKSGMRVSCGLLDELHEHKDRYTVDMMVGNTKGRRQPLNLIITNAGFDRTSVCWEWHKTGQRVLEGRIKANHKFFYIMALDLVDDPLTDPSCWPKTNPGLGITPTVQYLENQVSDARQIPGRENVVRRLNFCQWTDADVGWMTREVWEANEEELIERQLPGDDLTGGGSAIWRPGEGFAGADCYLSLDLAYIQDMVALTFTFPEGDLLCSWTEFWKPLGNTLADLRKQESNDDAPYIEWIRRGLIHGVPGPVVRKEIVGARIAEALGQYNVLHAAFDRYAHKALADEMAELGVDAPWIEHPQGFRRGGALRDKQGHPLKDENGNPIDNPLWMPSSLAAFETRLLEKRMRVQVCEVMRWQVASVAIRQDPAGTGNRVFDKARAVARIDGVVSQAMGVGVADAIFPSTDISDFLKRPVIAR